MGYLQFRNNHPTANDTRTEWVIRR